MSPPRPRFRPFGESSFFPSTAVQLLEVESIAGFSCADGTSVPFASSTVGDVGSGFSLQGNLAVVDPPPSGTGTVPLEETETVVATYGEQVVTATR